MKDRIADLREHVVVCGYGRVGRAVVASLVEAERDVVVVEQNEANWPDVEEEFASGRPVYLVKGDADDSDVLRRAGVPRAAGLVACVGSDAENMYIAFAARRCNESIRIVVRASDEDAERNLRQAEGLLTAAITPYRSAGAELARAVTSP